MQGLRSTEMFRGMGEGDLTSLERFSKLRSLQPGERIFKEGDAGDGLYFIIHGKIQISARFGDDQRRVFATFGPGEFFGEMAVLDDAPRSADAIAEEASEVYFVPRENLAEVLERNPKLALRMLRDFSRRLREFDRKYIDEALQVERLVTVGKFARTIIHDLKNPLHIIGMSAEMMSIQGTSPEMQAAGKSRIRRQVERMGKMVTEFLEFTRGDKTSSNLIETDYAQFVNEIIDELRPELTARSVNIEMAPAPPKVNVLVDPTRLAHVFYNLVSNSCDAMPGGGKIKIRIARKEREVVTEFEDSGKGIPSQIAERLFEPFATYGKAGGTGLGLSICKRVVDDHQGRMSVRQEAGRGAIFVFTLPVAADGQ
ncbi:MAG TPA: ATP-binding protein [Candidatus Angelobacter sp.]|nr:ATP-binding protein [Candidatus Angelobacter sp.]